MAADQPAGPLPIMITRSVTRLPFADIQIEVRIIGLGRRGSNRLGLLGFRGRVIVNSPGFPLARTRRSQHLEFSLACDWLLGCLCSRLSLVRLFLGCASRDAGRSTSDASVSPAGRMRLPPDQQMGA